MLPSFLLSLREGVEAALIVGIVLGALRHFGRTDCARFVWSGVASALAMSVVAAWLLRWLGWSLEGPAEPIFEGTMQFVAAALLTWMVFWMKRQSRHLRSDMTSSVRQAVGASGRRGVFVLTFVAVVREGIELALFLTAASLESGDAQITLGAGLGLAVAALLGWSLFASTMRLNLRLFFQATGALLILFSAGLIAKGVHEFSEVGWIRAGADPIWSTRAVLSEHSLPGSVLKTLLGYTPVPSLSMVIGYVIYLGVVALGLRAANSIRSATPRAAKVAPEATNVSG